VTKLYITDIRKIHIKLSSRWLVRECCAAIVHAGRGGDADRCARFAGEGCYGDGCQGADGQPAHHAAHNGSRVRAVVRGLRYLTCNTIREQ